MTDKTKTILKITGVIMGGIVTTIGVILLFNLLNFSCISAPDVRDGEPAVCSDAKYIAYAFHRNEKVPETVISNGLATCRNQLIWNFCEEKASNVEEDKKRDMFQSCWDKNKQQ